MTDRLHVVIEGLVQGVGFRHATYIKAQALGLRGWVRNLPDGRVEAQFEGDRPTLETMREWCHQGPYLSNVKRVTEHWEQSPAKYKSFEITF